MNVVGVLDRWASKQPEQAALIATRGGRDSVVSYAELREASSRLAGALRRSGVGPGDRVALLAGLSIDLYIGLIGALWAGAVPVIVDPGAGLARARACFDKAAPRALIGSRRLLLLARLLPELRHQPTLHVRARGDAAPIQDRAASDHALLTFTSGSTGVPSMVARTHGLLVAQNNALQEVLRQQPGECWLATLPIFVLAHLAEGATAVLADADLRRPGFVDSNRLWKQIARCQTDAVVASPSLLTRLAESPMRSCAFRKVLTGGAPVYPSTVEKLRPLSTSGDITVIYGSTEAEPIAHHVCSTGCSWDHSVNGSGLLVGLPCSAVQIRIIRDNGGKPVLQTDDAGFADHCVSPGQPGEIVVTGRHVVKGYVGGRGDARAKVHVDTDTGRTTWHRTGDAGYIDEAGRLWLLGRCSARVELPSQLTRYPFQIEVPLLERFEVRSAMMPVDSRPVLALARQHSDAQRLSRSDLDTLIPNGMRVVSVGSIPLDRRHNAKVDYGKLLELLR